VAALWLLPAQSTNPPPPRLSSSSRVPLNDYLSQEWVLFLPQQGGVVLEYCGLASKIAGKRSPLNPKGAFMPPKKLKPVVPKPTLSSSMDELTKKVKRAAKNPYISNPRKRG
jgi:hypothetical protein